MPRGIPVATVAVNGSANAAVLVVEMFSITDPELAKSLKTFRDAGAR
jgi:5-(carboxyamino)imidazole ribonucleotide mutase